MRRGTEGYAVPFSERDQQVLAERLRTVKGKWLVTNSDSQAVRQLYRGFPMRVLKAQLCLEKSHARQLRHLVITNYALPKQ